MKNNNIQTKAHAPHKKYRDLVRVRAVRPLEGFQVHFTFTDGAERVIDLEKHIWGPVFEPIRNSPELFRAMYVEDGTIVWPGDLDLDPDTLYFGENPIPWMVEYENRQNEKKARARRVGDARQVTTVRHKMPKAAKNKKGTKKSVRKPILAKSK